MPRQKIVIAADKFKGALSSFAVCHAIEQGLLQADAGFDIATLPLSDGGDGWAAVMAHYTNATPVFVTVHDPLFRPVQAAFLLSEDGQTAFVEMAQASGLMLLQPHEYDPLHTTTFGTGELLKAALQHGVSKIILGIGGSATNDGGIGMAAALGYRFLDVQGHELKPVGESLQRIETIDVSNKMDMGSVILEVACDVAAYLTGANGAATIYGPQKGATPQVVTLLEQGLQHFAASVQRQFQIDLATIKGGGAAGGLGAGCVLFLQAQLKSGVQLLLYYSNAERLIRQADLVLTGEGKIDAQTAQGKVVQGLLDLCATYNKPVVALCGTLELDAAQLHRLGLTAAFSIIDKPLSLEAALQQTEPLLTAAAYNIGNFFKTACLTQIQNR
jgi:glycerate kinase